MIRRGTARRLGLRTPPPVRVWTSPDLVGQEVRVLRTPMGLMTSDKPLTAAEMSRIRAAFLKVSIASNERTW